MDYPFDVVFALSLTADNSIITISGYVTCQGERISDVAIEAETTNDVTISDREGKFSVTVKKGGVVLFKKMDTLLMSILPAILMRT